MQRSRDRDIDYDLIVAGTEASLIGLKSQSLDASVRAKLVIPDESSVDVALSKHDTWIVAQELGIKVPRSVLVCCPDDLPEQPCYPLVIKPVTNARCGLKPALRNLVVGRAGLDPPHAEP